MSQPPPFSRAFSFTNYQAQNPSLSLPGSQVDLELNNAKATLDAVLANIKLIQRDDGAVANASIGLDQLKAEVPVGFNAPVVWVTGTAYTAGSSTVFQGSGFYRCLVTHTSGVFATDLAAAKWQLIVNLAAVPLVNASQIAVTPSGSLTSDAQSSLQALDAGKAPTSHTHPSSAISDSTAAGRALLTAVDANAQNVLLGTNLLGFQSGDIKETAGLVLPSGWYWCDGSNKNRVTDVNLFNAITIQQTGTTTSGSAVVTGLSDTTNGGNVPICPGMPVSGTGIPAGTTVQSVDSATQVTLSQNATGSATVPFVFAPYGVGDGSSTFGVPDRSFIAVGRDNASGTASNTTQVSTTISTTSGSASATVGSATGILVGMRINHPKVPFGSTVSAISGTTITMSNNATATVTTSAVRFSPLTDAQTPGARGGNLSTTFTIATTNLPPYTPSGSVTSNSTSTFTGSGNVVTVGAGGTSGGSSTPGVAPPTGTVSTTTTSTFSGNAQGGTSTPISAVAVPRMIVTGFIIKR